MTAETIAKVLGGRKAGGGWMARCPAHADREPSLSISDARDGKLLVRCHAGCDQQKVIAALKARGIWQGTDRRDGTRIRSQPSPAAKDEPDRDDAERTQTALRLWGASVPATGTLVETYLRSRGIAMPIPAALRFHGGTEHARGLILRGCTLHEKNGRRWVGIPAKPFVASDGGQGWVAIVDFRDKQTAVRFQEMATAAAVAAFERVRGAA
jgi:putative DNA primase/helicase